MQSLDLPGSPNPPDSSSLTLAAQGNPCTRLPRWHTLLWNTFPRRTLRWWMLMCSSNPLDTGPDWPYTHRHSRRDSVNDIDTRGNPQHKLDQPEHALLPEATLLLISPHSPRIYCTAMRNVHKSPSCVPWLQSQLDSSNPGCCKCCIRQWFGRWLMNTCQRGKPCEW